MEKEHFTAAEIEQAMMDTGTKGAGRVVRRLRAAKRAVKRGDKRDAWRKRIVAKVAEFEERLHPVLRGINVEAFGKGRGAYLALAKKKIPGFDDLGKKEIEKSPMSRAMKDDVQLVIMAWQESIILNGEIPGSGVANNWFRIGEDWTKGALAQSVSLLLDLDAGELRSFREKICEEMA